MSIYHVHHIIPRHMGGTDDSSNLIQLTIEEHAEAHRKLYEEHGNYRDLMAWKGLSGQLNKKNLIRELQSLAAKEKNDREIEAGTHPFLGDNNPSRKKVKSGTHHFQQNIGNRPGDIAQRQLVSQGKHYFQSDTHKNEVSARAKKLIKETSQCPHCNKIGQKAAMGRWHFDNCRQR